MNSYIYLISEIKATQERLRRFLRPPSEVKEIGNPEGRACPRAERKVRTVAQPARANVEALIWGFGCLAAFAGVLMAAQWHRHLFWLLVWPLPTALACTTFVLVRQGFYFENGALVLGHRRG